MCSMCFWEKEIAPWCITIGNIHFGEGGLLTRGHGESLGAKCNDGQMVCCGCRAGVETRWF